MNTNPNDMTAEQRLGEIAELLARGILRLRKQTAREPQQPKVSASDDPQGEEA